MINELGLITTLRCNSKCDHCYMYPRKPSYKSEMTAKDVKRYLSNLGEDFPKRIELYGGEPFLYLKELVKIIKVINSLTTTPNIHIITNGFWGESPEEAGKVLKIMGSLNVKEIILSVDCFHQKYIKLESIINIVKTAKLMNINNLAINSIWLPDQLDSKYNISTDMVLKELKEVSAEKVNFYKYPFMAVGNVTYKLMENATLMQKIPDQVCIECYGNEFLKPTVADIYPNGDLVFCMGYKIGNVNDKPVNQILKEFDFNNFKILNLLCLKGTKSLLEFAKMQGYKENKYINKCHLCYDIRTFLKDKHHGELV